MFGGHDFGIVTVDFGGYLFTNVGSGGDRDFLPLPRNAF